MPKYQPGAGPSGPDVPPPPGFLVSPKLGIAGLAIALVVVVISFVAAGVFFGSDDAPPVPVDPMAIPPAKLQMLTPGELAAILPEEVSRELEDELTAWFASESRSAIFDEEGREEPEWLAHLIDPEVRERMDRLPLRVFGTLANVPATHADPSASRGRLVVAWGRVETVDELELLVPSGPLPVWRLHVTDPSGVPFQVTTIGAPPTAVEQGSWVKLGGVFVKLWPVDGRPALHVFSTRSPVVSYPPVQHREPQLEWLEQVRDADPRTSTTMEDEPFYGMLNYVRTLGPEGYRELRDAGEIPVVDLTGPQGVTPLVENPQAHRFRAVRMRLAPIHEEFVVDRSMPENPGNIAFVYRGYMVDDQMRPVFWVSPFPRDTFDLKGARVVEAEGFFLKRRMAAGANDKNYWLPILIGTDLEAVGFGGTGVGADLSLIAIVVAAGSLMMLVAFIVVWLRTRVAEESVRRRAADRRARREGFSSGA